MAELKYTKGAWELNDVNVQEVGGECRHIFIIGGKDSPMRGRTIADVGCWKDRINPEADARLIAAAPDLYEALKELSQYIQFNMGNACPVYEKAMKALTEVEGKDV